MSHKLCEIDYAKNYHVGSSDFWTYILQTDSFVHHWWKLVSNRDKIQNIFWISETEVMFLLLNLGWCMCYFTWYETRKGIRWHGVWWHISVWRTNLWCSTKSLRNLVGIFSIVFVKSRLYLRRCACPYFWSLAWLDCNIFCVFCIVWACNMAWCSP